MFKTTVALLLFTPLFVCSQRNEVRISEIATIVTDVITRITSKRAGITLCWFYIAQPDPQPDNLLGMIQQQPTLQDTPRLTFKQRLPTPRNWPYRLPTILLMDLRGIYTRGGMLPRLEYVVFKDTLILVFVDRTDTRSMHPIWRKFEGAGLLNVFVFCTNSRDNFHENAFTMRRTYIEAFPALLFPDHARDVHGYHFRASLLSSTTYAIFQDDNTPFGPLIDWIAITAGYINATFSVTRVYCPTRGECMDNMFEDGAGGAYEMNVDSLQPHHAIMLRTAVRSVVPTEQGLIAPRSPRVKIHELFVAPFRVEVWITLALLLVTCILVVQLFPNQFHNNLILLTLCSFERIALHRVQRLEKMVAISLIIFFFILLSAYESLFISLMTNRPRLRNPRTIADLLAAGIFVEQNAVKLDKVNEDIRPLLRNISRAKATWLDGRSAYYDGKDYMKWVMRHPDNFDPESGESRYVMLDYSTWGGFGYHLFTYQSLLDHKFRFSQTALVESGIYWQLMERMEHKYFRGRRYQAMVHHFQPSVTILDMQHVSPAWIVLGVGWSLSFGAAVAELAWFKVYRIYAGRKRAVVQRRRRHWKLPFY